MRVGPLKNEVFLVRNEYRSETYTVGTVSEERQWQAEKTNFAEVSMKIPDYLYTKYALFKKPPWEKTKRG